MVMKLEKANISLTYDALLNASAVCRLAQIASAEFSDQIAAEHTARTLPGDLEGLARALELANKQLSIVSEFMSDLEFRADRGEFA